MSNRTSPVYTVTVYAAAPGTPIRGGEPSLPGHLYYKISDGREELGYGFAPEPSAVVGPGEVHRNEFETYQNPYYARTLEITPQQYAKLKEFGEAGARKEETFFDLHYNVADNSCVDFVWAGLSHAGLGRSLPLPDGQRIPDRDFDGKLIPVGNVASIQSIQAPFPHSPHNSEVRNPLPQAQRIMEQREDLDWNLRRGIRDLMCDAMPGLPLCPEAGASLTPSAPNPRRAFQHPELSPDRDLSTFLDRMLLASQVGDDATFRKMSQALADHPAVDDMRREAVATVDRWEELERQQQMEQQQAQERRGPVMRM